MDRDEQSWREAFNKMNMTPIGRHSAATGEVFVGESSSMGDHDDPQPHFKVIWAARRRDMPGWFTQRILHPFGSMTREQRADDAIKQAKREVFND